jgi:hypothetical protein
MRSALLQVSPNRFAHKSNVLQLGVPEATHVDVPLCFQERVALCIGFVVFRKSMLASVEFKIVASFSTVEVEVVTVDFMLAPKLIRRKTAVAE